MISTAKFLGRAILPVAAMLAMTTTAACAERCVAYDQRITVDGVLAHGARPERTEGAPSTSFVVNLDRPLCAAASRDDAATFAGRVPLVFADAAGASDAQRTGLGRAVECSGRLKAALSDQRHGDVLLVDATCEPALRPSPASLAAHLDRDGASRTFAALDRQPVLFEAMMDGIETAEPSWLRIARRLRRDADGGNAEGLDMAIARALPNEPSRILALVGRGFDLDRVCTSPFIEPEAGVAETYASRTLTALETVRSPRLRPLAVACEQRVKLPLR